MPASGVVKTPPARHWRWALIGLLAVAASALHAEPGVQTYRAQYRPAEELAGVLQPLLRPDEAAIGQGAVLIVQAAPARAAQLLEVARSLDLPAQRLRIRVRQADTGRAGAVGGGVEMDDDAVRLYGGAAQRRRHGTADQFVAAQNGRSAHISAGIRVPERYVQRDRYGNERETVEYRDLSTGFDVVPHVVGEQVTLEISPYADDGLHFSAAQTTLTGRLGQWLPLAGSVTQRRDRQSALTGAARGVQQTETTLELLVEAW